MVQSLKPATFRNQFFPILVDFEAMAGEHMRKNRGIFFCLHRMDILVHIVVIRPLFLFEKS